MIAPVNDVFIGIPHAGVLKTDMALSLAGMMAADRIGESRIGGIINSGGPYLIYNANAIVRHFLDTTKGQWLLSVEWDHQFTAETLYCLLDCDKPLVGAMYWLDMKGGGLQICASASRSCFHGYTEVPDNTLFEAGAIGFGFTLIHRSVLEAMQQNPAPDVRGEFTWFDMIPGVNNHGEEIMIGHDVVFCQRARHAGFSSWCHSGIQVTHVDKGRTLGKLLP